MLLDSKYDLNIDGTRGENTYIISISITPNYDASEWLHTVEEDNAVPTDILLLNHIQPHYPFLNPDFGIQAMFLENNYKKLKMPFRERVSVDF